MRKRKYPWLDHMRACERLGILTLDPSQMWGVRVNRGYPHNDVDGGYRTQSDAELSLSLYPKYGLPAAELVKRVNGTWCNVW